LRSGIERILKAWPKQASVTHWIPTFPGGTELDYPLSTVPVASGAMEALAPEIQQSISNCLWIQYNRRTIDAEDYIANPAIDILLREEALPLMLRTALQQTAIDERYHTYFHSLALEEALRRCVTPVDFARSVTVRELFSRLEDCHENWERKYVQIAYAAVAEVSVNAFLELLSRSTEIKKSNRDLVDQHNLDEWFHSSIFVEVIQYLIDTLPSKEAAFLQLEIRRASHSFLKHDFSLYESVFAAHAVSLPLNRTQTLMSRDMSGIERLIGALK
jgi:hypothetical protein